HCMKLLHTFPALGLLELPPFPRRSLNIQVITWRKENNKLAEWISNKVDYYGRCRTKDQCDLNSTTGVFIMKGLKPEDTGNYFVDLNSLASAKTFQLAVLEAVSKPHVSKSCGESRCTLTCVGKETEYAEYSWKKNRETLKEGNTLTVGRTGFLSQSYTCVFRNPKSEAKSDPVYEMDLFACQYISKVLRCFSRHRTFVAQRGRRSGCGPNPSVIIDTVFTRVELAPFPQNSSRKMGKCVCVRYAGKKAS
uniref:Ig-like domain-containing protein n=1 Tax=Scleropages formosus TaxID=113540 RepID=A0A8C9SEZ1_SCLFO